MDSPQGEDVRLGAAVLQPGQRLTPQALGLAASVGAGTLQVLRRPRVAIFSTGDELMMPGEPLRPGAIYNSNRFVLRGLAQASGCVPTDLGIVPDRLDATVLRCARRRRTTTSSSPAVVSRWAKKTTSSPAAAEGSVENWQIAMKPGKPLAFGHIRRPDGSAALLLGLPGNPVSSFITWLLAAGTVLRTLQGMQATLPAGLPLRADFNWPRADRRREFSARAAQRPGRRGTVRQPELGRADLGRVGRRPGGQPAGQAIAAGDLFSHR
jgi:molybdopterin molybdotransferase